jgi:hypothetical protein
MQQISQNFFVFAAALTAFDPACDPRGQSLATAIATGLSLIELAPDPRE